MFTFFNLIYIVLFVIPVFILSKLLTNPRIPKGLKQLPTVSGWPLVGILFNIKGPLFARLYALKQEHGEIFTIRMGCRDIIVMTTSTMIHKTLKDMGNNFAGRWKNIIVRTLAHNSGIVFTDKEWWAKQRSFVLKVLRDFGFGKQKSQEIVNNECNILLKEIEESCGQVVSTRNLFPKSMVNVIAKLVMNMRFERSDSNFQKVTTILEMVTNNRNIAVNALLMYPILEKSEFFSRLLLKIFGRDRKIEDMHDFIRLIIKEHENRFNPENEGEDVIDVFLKEKYKLDSSGIRNHTFTDWQLVRVAFELFAAGYETTSTTLSWSMILLAKHQQIQEKIHREIIDIIGSSRMPTLADKKSMNYTQAVMDEIMRVSSVVPNSIPRRVFENTAVDGYFIPKDSIVFSSTYCVHHDTNTWSRPFEFYPEHFLTESDGILKYNPRDELMPFGLGKRQCLGESLARLEFFIFLTSIIQRFKIKFPEDVDDDEFKRIIIGTDGGIRAPLKREIVCELWQ